MDIREIIVRLRAGHSNRQISRDLGIDRRTVKGYRQWAKKQDLLRDELPPVEEMQALLEETWPEKAPPQNVSSVEPYRPVVEKLVKEQVETAAIHQRLKERGYRGSYSAVYRFVRRVKGQLPEATVRVERAPGEEGQVDFGYGGRMLDPETGQMRRTWAFVMTLSFSRHQYVEFVFDQKVETWLRCHRNAFNFFGGVPERVVIDNLKAAIVKAIQDDPAVQASYRECAMHYGFLIAPCRTGTPQHKGKVEQGGVHYVKRNFLGGREATTITQANREVLVWYNTTAGQRQHGTTKEQPLKRFEETEQARLQPLPETAYDLAIWKELTLGWDCYVEFERREKVPGLVLNRDNCGQAAEQIGPATAQVVQALLDDPVLDRLPTIGRLLKLSRTYGDQRLEAACVRALAFDDPSYKTVKGILKKGLEQEPAPETPPSSSATIFVRPLTDLLGSWLGGLSWN